MSRNSFVRALWGERPLYVHKLGLVVVHGAGQGCATSLIRCMSGSLGKATSLTLSPPRPQSTLPGGLGLSAPPPSFFPFSF